MGAQLGTPAARSALTAWRSSPCFPGRARPLGLIRTARAPADRVAAFGVGKINQSRIPVATEVVVRADLGNQAVAESVPLSAMPGVTPAVFGRCPLLAELDHGLVVARDRVLHSPFGCDQAHDFAPVAAQVLISV